ncbi:hypothetical protein [Metabacillus sp. RGM 3146]|uniref:hypothetical protein n=1 Tax=Metabacillus sp. RGM 3146 TaxID=3401092 RepID=UPI003B99B682
MDRSMVSHNKLYMANAGEDHSEVSLSVYDLSNGNMIYKGKVTAKKHQPEKSSSLFIASIQVL